MFIDSHCHLDRVDLQHFDNNFDTLINNIRQQDVDRMLCVSINLESYHHMRELVENYDFIDVSVGNHPSDAAEHTSEMKELLRLGADKKVVAIGETGLDYYHTRDTMEIQQQSFRTHIQVANQLLKPLIIHTRDAQQDTIRIMQEEQAQRCGGVMHCFTESWAMAEQSLELGFYISFSGIVTFRNAEALREVARKVPDDRFLIETDSPYLAPVPHRGKKNYPGWVKHVAECLAEVRGVSLESIAELSTHNYQRLFVSGKTHA
jgi:TatD DNase family protein